MVTMVKSSSKLGQSIIAKASVFKGTTLCDVYERCSVAKQRAYADCYKRFMEDNASFNFHICSSNTNFFSVAWNYINELTGEVMTHYETASNIFIVDGRS